MKNNEGLGPKAVKVLADTWIKDHTRSRWHEHGFDWWPGDFRVSVTAFPRKDGQGPETWLLSVRTDFLKDVPINDSTFVKLGAVTSRFYTSTYAWVYPPAEVWEQYGQPDEAPKLQFSNTAYVTAENVEWLPGFLAWISVMQPINAQIQSKNTPSFFGRSVPDISRPEPPASSHWEQMLEAAAQIYVPMGREVSRWIGTDEFSTIAKEWGRSQYCYGNGDNKGLALETSFGNDTALIRLHTDQKHPQLGNGLLATLQIPVFKELKEIADECAFLNLLETMWTAIPQIGCWHPHQSRGELEGMAFSMFIPNALHQMGLAFHVALWMMDRANWVRQTRYPHLTDKPINEILEARLSAA